MSIVFIVGTAGSGKSLLTSSLFEWLTVSKQKVGIVNLDPGVIVLPYTPNLDVRDYVNIRDLMEEHQLGPNGALVMATDLIAGQINTLAAEVEDLNLDLVLVDTPGQMELFAFRISGQVMAKELTKRQKILVYLFDSVFSINPLNYVSNLFLSAAVYNRFLLPQVHVLSKCDLLPPEKMEGILDWSTNQETLETAIEQKLKAADRLLSRDMIHAIYNLGLSFPLIPTSARTNDGILNLTTAMERMLVGGEKFTC